MKLSDFVDNLTCGNLKKLSEFYESSGKFLVDEKTMIDKIDALPKPEEERDINNPGYLFLYFRCFQLKAENAELKRKLAVTICDEKSEEPVVEPEVKSVNWSNLPELEVHEDQDGYDLAEKKNTLGLSLREYKKFEMLYAVYTANTVVKST